MDWDKLKKEAMHENLLRTLIRMARTDGKVVELEWIYIIKVGLSLGLKEEAIRLLWNEEGDELYIPKDEKSRMKIFYYLLHVLNMDKIISKYEDDLLHHYGFLLGFHPIMIRDLLDNIKKRHQKGQKMPNLTNIIKKYYN